MQRLVNALHETTKLQLELLEQFEKRHKDSGLTTKIKEYRKIINNMKNFLPREKKTKYPQEIEFDGNNIKLVQKDEGGKYILWTDDTSCATQCGITYVPDGYDTEWFDLFLSETKGEDLTEKPDNKDIDLYLFGNPFQDDYEFHKKVSYEDILQVAKEIQGENNE